MMEQVKVDGEVCTFNEDEHTYSVDGETIPGVTSITGIIDKSSPIKWWAVNAARDYITDNFRDHIPEDNPYDEVGIQELADKARTAHMSDSSSGITVGNIVHEYAEDYIEHDINGSDEPEFPNNKEAQEAAIEFLDWYDTHDVEPLQTEQMVYHPGLGYAGTYDLKAYVDGELVIIDFKTSSGIYEDYYAQVSGYLRAEELREGAELDGMGIVRFPKDSAGFESEIITYRDEIARHWEGFVSCKGVYDWQEQN